MDGRFTRRQLIKGTLAVSLVPAIPLARRYRVDVPPLPWPAANDIVAATTIPTFPDRNFPITGYGAKNDGKTDNTAAIGKAIDACTAAGGGHVVVPSGTFLTGAILLKSNVDLNLEAGAVLKFSGDASKFPNVLTRYEGIECINRSPMIYAHGEKNIAVTGSGMLDAAGTSSWNKGSDRAYLETLVAKGTPPEKRVVPGSGHAMRSTFIEPYSCDTVLIQGITLKNPMFWQIHPTLCKQRHRRRRQHRPEHRALQHRRLRPRVVRPRRDQQLQPRRARRQHRHQVRPGRRRAAGQRAVAEHRGRQLHDERQLGRDHLRQRASPAASATSTRTSSR